MEDSPIVVDITSKWGTLDSSSPSGSPLFSPLKTNIVIPLRKHEKSRDNVGICTKDAAIKQLQQISDLGSVVWSDYIDYVTFLLTSKERRKSISLPSHSRLALTSSTTSSNPLPDSPTKPGGQILPNTFQKATKIIVMTTDYLLILQLPNYEIERRCRIDSIQSVLFEPARSNEGYVGLEYTVVEEDYEALTMSPVPSVGSSNGSEGSYNPLSPALQTTIDFGTPPATFTFSPKLRPMRTRDEFACFFSIRRLEFFEYLDFCAKALMIKRHGKEEVFHFSSKAKKVSKFKFTALKDVLRYIEAKVREAANLEPNPTLSPFLLRPIKRRNTDATATDDFSDEEEEEEEDNPFMIELGADKKFFQIPIVGNSSVCQWLIRYDDAKVICAIKVHKRTIKDELIPKLLIVTDLAFYLISMESFDLMERRIVLHDIEKIVVEHGSHSGSAHTDFCVIVPSEYDVYIRSELADRIVALIRAQCKTIELQYLQHIINVSKLKVTAAYKKKVKQQEDPNYIRSCITEAVDKNDERALQRALEMARVRGMEKENVYILGETELKTCKEAQVIREKMDQALKKCQIEELLQYVEYSKQYGFDHVYKEYSQQYEKILAFFNTLSISVRSSIKKFKKIKRSTPNVKDIPENLKVESPLDTLLSCQYLLGFLERASELLDTTAIEELMVAAKFFKRFPPEIAEATHAKGTQLLRRIERFSNVKLQELLVIRKRLTELTFHFTVKKSLFPPPAKKHESYHHIEQMKIVLDIFDSLGFHQQSLELLAEFKNVDYKKETLEASVKLPLSTFDNPSMIQSFQTHMVFSVQFVSNPTSATTPRTSMSSPSSSFNKKPTLKSSKRYITVRITTNKKSNSNTLMVPKHGRMDSFNVSNAMSSSPDVISTPRLLDYLTPRSSTKTDSSLTSRSTTDLLGPTNEGEDKDYYKFYMPVRLDPDQKNLLCVLSRVSETVQSTRIRHTTPASSPRPGFFNFFLKKKKNTASEASFEVPATPSSSSSISMTPTLSLDSLLFAEDDTTTVKWKIMSIGRTLGVSCTHEEMREVLGVLRPPASMIVKVLEGRALAAKDWNGKSDPYVVVEYEDHKHKTKVEKATLNPIWTDQEFEFPVKDRDSLIRVTCWDFDLVGGHDYMGEFTINILKVEPGKARWYQLQNVKKRAEEVHGEIKVEIVFDFGQN